MLKTITTKDEAKALTREDLYSDMEDFHTTKYNYDRKSPMPQVTAEDAGAAALTAGKTIVQGDPPV